MVMLRRPDGTYPGNIMPQIDPVHAAWNRVACYDDYEDALDRRVSMGELQLFDREVARAESAHAALLSAQARS